MLKYLTELDVHSVDGRVPDILDAPVFNLEKFEYSSTDLGKVPDKRTFVLNTSSLGITRSAATVPEMLLPAIANDGSKAEDSFALKLMEIDGNEPENFGASIIHKYHRDGIIAICDGNVPDSCSCLISSLSSIVS
jgi:hypothetical protein